jgi:thiol-disulfide isomerase/thioredoxin
MSQSGTWGFQETIDSPMSRIILSATTVDYAFDRGMVQRLEARKGRKFGVTGTETEILELKSVEMADVGTLAQESALLFDAHVAYWDLEDRSVTDASKHGKADAVLVEAREKLSNPILREQVDTLLARHRRNDSFGSERAAVFAQLLGKPGPEWEAKDLDGKTHSTKGYRGKVVILDFWDRGCGWCIRAMPQLKAIQEEFNGQPFQLLGMSLDEDEKNARLVVEEMGINYPTVRAIGLSEGYKVGGIPHLVILDQEGKIADIHVGYAPTLKERVSKTVKELLERK